MQRFRQSWQRGNAPPPSFLALLFCASLGFGKEKSLTAKAEESIQAQWGKEISLQFEKLKIKPEWKKSIEAQAKQSFFRPEVYFWTVSKKDSAVGYALMDNVLGKSLPITFLLQFDGDGRIVKGEVLKYREPYGGGVQSAQWNTQFQGRTGDSSFLPNVNIDGISGATISVQSLAKGYWKSALLVEHLRK